jgi:hypothetical protein
VTESTDVRGLGPEKLAELAGSEVGLKAAARLSELNSRQQAEITRLQQLVAMLLNRTYEGKVTFDGGEQAAVKRPFVLGETAHHGMLDLWVEFVPQR